MKREDITRRAFLEHSALTAATASTLPAIIAETSEAAPKPKLPQRVLGRTGVKVPVLAFGCGSRFLMYKAEEASAILNQVIDSGITYLDTAMDYGKGESETRVGNVMTKAKVKRGLAT